MADYDPGAHAVQVLEDKLDEIRSGDSLSSLAIAEQLVAALLAAEINLITYVPTHSPTAGLDPQPSGPPSAAGSDSTPTRPRPPLRSQLTVLEPPTLTVSLEGLAHALGTVLCLSAIRELHLEPAGDGMVRLEVVGGASPLPVRWPGDDELADPDRGADW